MAELLSLRWREKKCRFRPPEETIHTRDYSVEPIPGDAAAKAFVVSHHYSGSYPAARFRFGLYKKDSLCGVAVFSHPVNQNTLL